MLKKLVDLLPKKLAKHGLTRPVLAAQIVHAWPEVVLQVCGNAYPKAKALSFNVHNVLTIRCEHSALAQELAGAEQDIVKAYQKLFPQVNINLRFQWGRANPGADTLWR